MKKEIFAFLILLPVLLFPQRNDFALKIGIYTPYDLKSGVIYGIDYGSKLNENITFLSYETYNNISYKSETNSLTYNGFVWQAGGGILFRIGRRSNLIFEIMHNSALFEKEERFNTFTTLNSSGAIFRFGLDFNF
jgi:hypothetical protein